MFRLFTTVSESCLPPALSHGLPGARCIREKVMRMTKKRIGTIQRIRRTMKMASAPLRVVDSARSCGGSRAPRTGRPAVTANLCFAFLLVLRDVRRVVPSIAGKVLVVRGGHSQALDVRL